MITNFRDRNLKIQHRKFFDLKNGQTKHFQNSLSAPTHQRGLQFGRLNFLTPSHPWGSVNSGVNRSHLDHCVWQEVTNVWKLTASQSGFKQNKKHFNSFLQVLSSPGSPQVRQAMSLRLKRNGKLTELTNLWLCQNLKNLIRYETIFEFQDQFSRKEY